MLSKSYSIKSTEVNRILQDIEQDKIGIPEMQRPFVWSKVQVRDLIDSLY